MINVNYLLEIKIETKSSATPVGFEPETLAVGTKTIDRSPYRI